MGAEDQYRRDFELSASPFVHDHYAKIISALNRRIEVLDESCAEMQEEICRAANDWFDGHNVGGDILPEAEPEYVRLCGLANRSKRALRGGGPNVLAQ